jgi:4-hydroxy-tetrahydrodipicolinate synthase
MSLTSNQHQHPIKGPVYPVVTPFTNDGSVDRNGLKNYIEYLVSNGAKNILVTVGTSRFNLLSKDEMKDVNKVVSTTTQDKDVCTIVSGPGPHTGSTQENIDFATHANSVGADAIMLLYPERWYGMDPIIKFFRDIGQSTDMPILAHTFPMRDGFGSGKEQYFDVELLDELLKIDNFVGIKEESKNREISDAICAEYSDKMSVIIGGGGMSRYLTDSELGATAYLTGIGSFLPEVAENFYELVNQDKKQQAKTIIEEYEEPYFDTAVSMGWHRALKETLYQLDIIEPFERNPLQRVNEKNVDKLTDILDGCGWM